MKISISENLLNNPGYLIYNIKAIYVKNSTILYLMEPFLFQYFQINNNNLLTNVRRLLYYNFVNKCT